MSLEILFVLGIVLLAVLLFATEKLAVDLVAMIVMGLLLLSGIITPEEGISGFSNPATVTVAAMFILSAGLFRTGAVNFLGMFSARLFRLNFWIAVAAIMIAAGSLSAFVNNTPVVAIFIPILLAVARDNDLSPSKILMPLSFASMFGGVCTLIGTSTNILVNSIGQRHGLPAFSLFEFASLGVVFFAVGVVYMISIGIRLIPDRRERGDLTQNFRMGEYLTEIVLLPDAKTVGKTIRDSPLVQEMDVAILEVLRDGKRLPIPSASTVLQANDVLRVRANVEKIRKLQERQGIVLKPQMKWRDKDLESEEVLLVEAVVAPNSALEGRTLTDVRFKNTYGATVLAIRHRGTLMREQVGLTVLRAGDALLLEVDKEHLERLRRMRSFVVVSEVDLPVFRKRRMIYAIGIMALVVALAALGVFPIVAAAVVGAVAMVLSGCITLEEAYEAIEWKVVFLLAGVLTLGIGLEKTGAASYVSNLLISTIGDWGPVAVVSALYILTSLLTETMSNNATAVLLAPIAIATAESMGVSARPFLMAVTFAASASFMTPVGYQTNTMIYGVGQYKFGDFIKVGTPLNIIFWLLATFLIPQIWPF